MRTKYYKWTENINHNGNSVFTYSTPLFEATIIFDEGEYKASVGGTVAGFDNYDSAIEWAELTIYNTCEEIMSQMDGGSI